MADQGPGALGQDATQIESGARSSADQTRAAAAPDYSPLEGVKITPHGDAKANLRASIKADLATQGIDTSSLNDHQPAPAVGGPPSSAMVGNSDDSGTPGSPFALSASPAAAPSAKTFDSGPPPSAMTAVKDSTVATGKELGNGLMRGALWAANGLGFGTVALSHIVDAPDRTMGRISDAEQGDSDAKVFDFLHNYVDSARDYWQNSTPETSNPYAKTIGDVAEGAAPLLAGGPAAIPLMALSAGMERGKGIIDTRSAEDAHQRTLDGMASGNYNAQARRDGAGASQGVNDTHDVHTAVLGAIIAAGTNAAEAGFLPLKNGSVVRRALGSVGLGITADTASDVALKAILKDRGFQTAAEGIDPSDPQSIVKSGMMQAIFAVLHKPDVAAKIKSASPSVPPPSAAKTSTGVSSAQPPEPIQGQGTPQGPLPSTASWAKPTPTVADTPSAEPSVDLRAQFKDMGNSATPRFGVFVSTENAANLKGAGNLDKVAITNQISRAEKEDRTVDMGNGTLVLKSKKQAADVAARLKGGEDPQSIIGEATGAGTGKRPDQTHVVQGKTPEGAVVNETSVAPHEIAPAVEAVQKQGNTPVVTTPEEAVQRRADMVQAENASEPKDGMTPKPNVVQFEGSGAEPKRPPLVQGKDAAEKIYEQAVADDTERAHAASAETKRPPLRPGVDDAEEIFHEQVKDDMGATQEVPAAAVKKAVAAKMPKAYDADKVNTDMRRVHAEELEGNAREDITDYYNRVRGAVGDTLPKLREIFPAGFDDDTNVEDQIHSAARKALEDKYKLGAEAEPLKIAPAGTKKAVAPKTAMSGLRAALTTHEVLDTPRDGKKFAAGIGERKENAAAFGTVLEQAAKERATEAPEQAKRALDAAKELTKWETHGEEENVKGVVTHAAIDGLVKEAHSAARELLGVGTEADKPTGLKARELKSKAELDARKTRAAAKATATPKVVKAKKAAPVVDKIATAAADKMRKLTSEYLDLDKDHEQDATAKIHEIEEHVHDFLSKSDKFNPDTVQSILHALINERDAKYAGKHSSATMGESVGDQVPGGESKLDQREMLEGGGTSVIHRALSGIRFLGEVGSEKIRRMTGDAAVKRLKDEWRNLALVHSERGSLFSKLQANTDSSGFIGSKDLLKELISHPEANRVAPHIVNMMMKLAHVMPDVPVFGRSRDNIIRQDARGNFVRGSESGLAVTTRNARNRVELAGMDQATRAERLAQHLQIDTSDTDKGRMLSTIVHEMWHTGTAYEMDNNPTGEFATKMEEAYETLRTRMANKYDEQTINDHVAFFNRGVDKPTGYMPHLYGLTNAKEMISEIWSNPKFMNEVIDSEQYAMPSEPAMEQKQSLLERIFSAIGKLFGVQDPKLMKHIMQLSMDVGSEQKKHFGWFQNTSADVQAQRMPPAWQAEFTKNSDASSPLEQARAAAGLRNLKEPAQDLEPKWIETEMNAALRRDNREANDPDPTKPDTMIGATRNWVHTVSGKSLDAIRSTKMYLKSWDQLLRDHVKDFGTDDSTNPFRRLQSVLQSKEVIMHGMRGMAKDAASRWAKLNPDEDLSVSKVMRDSTLWGIDPRLAEDEQSTSARANKGFNGMFTQITNAYSKLPDHIKDVYDMVTDLNAKLQDERRKAGIDTALATFDSTNVTDKQRQSLYDVRHPSEYDRLIGPGKPIDMGPDNDKFHEALKDFSAAQEIDGPYHHLGRQGEFVVAPEREGTKAFDTRAEAEKFAESARTMSPDSTAKIREGGGKHNVDYNIDYIAMHDNLVDANAEKDKLNQNGFETGNVTRKTTDKQNAPLSYGMKELLSEAERKLQKGSADPKEIEAQVAALRSSFLQIQAARSAYAGSRLARRNFGGVLAKDMRRNFSDHTMSTIWHVAQMRTVFDEAKAMAAMRTAARSQDGNQTTGLRRGMVVKQLNARALDDVSGMGLKSPVNTVLAKIAYYRYLASPAHAMIWMTQNPTAGLAIAGAKWGYGKSTASIARTGFLTAGPAMRATMREAFKRGGSSEEIHNAVLSRIANSKGRYAQYAPQLKAMMERGVIAHSYADEMQKLQQSSGDTKIGRTADLAMQWARMLPAMADAVNRTSSALTALELTGGDVRQATDYVNQTHADYSSQNKPLLFKQIGRLPGGNTLTSFMTYQQNMFHLTYGNLAASFGGDRKLEASKTLAGLMLSNAIFAGVYAGSAILPVQLAAYAYSKLKDEGEVFDLQSSIHHFLVDHFGEAGNYMSEGVVAHGLGISLKSRMGLADLFFRNQPDLLNGDIGGWKQMVYDHSGTFIQDMANSVTASSKAMGQGDIMGSLSPWVPFKLFQDGVKAAGLWEDGKRNGYGSQMTGPSAGDAIKQIVGFTPESVSNSQDKQSVLHMHTAAHTAVKDSITKDFTSAADGSPEQKAVGKRIDAYNDRNPSNPIKAQDLRSGEKYKARTDEGFVKDERAAADATY